MDLQFSFYKVGKTVTASKMEALYLHNKTGLHPTWHFNDEKFGACDWTAEPPYDLAEIYRQRASQLRERYDYVVLFFSGGADSTNVLHTFINNNIQLDEILCFHTAKGSGQQLGPREQEIFRVALPEARRAQKINSKIKIREIDLTERIIEFYSEGKNRFDQIYQKNDFWTPNHMALIDLAKSVPDWKRIADAGQSICLLRAADKPRIFIDEKGYHCKFLDLLVNNSSSVNIFNNKLDFVDELFYYAGDMPAVIIKQSHVLKRYLESADENSFGLTKQRTPFHAKLINGTQYYMTEHCLHRLLYPTWDINTFSMGKHSLPMASPSDVWFFEKTKNDHTYRNYRMHLDAIKNMAGEYWAVNNEDIVCGLKGMWSRSYYL